MTLRCLCSSTPWRSHSWAFSAATTAAAALCIPPDTFRLRAPMTEAARCRPMAEARCRARAGAAKSGHRFVRRRGRGRHRTNLFGHGQKAASPRALVCGDAHPLQAGSVPCRGRRVRRGDRRRRDSALRCAASRRASLAQARRESRGRISHPPAAARKRAARACGLGAAAGDRIRSNARLRTGRSSLRDGQASRHRTGRSSGPGLSARAPLHARKRLDDARRGPPKWRSTKRLPRGSATSCSNRLS